MRASCSVCKPRRVKSRLKPFGAWERAFRSVERPLDALQMESGQGSREMMNRGPSVPAKKICMCQKLQTPQVCCCISVMEGKRKKKNHQTGTNREIYKQPSPGSKCDKTPTGNQMLGALLGHGNIAAEMKCIYPKVAMASLSLPVFLIPHTLPPSLLNRASPSPPLFSSLPLSY